MSAKIWRPDSEVLDPLVTTMSEQVDSFLPLRATKIESSTSRRLVSCDRRKTPSSSKDLTDRLRVLGYSTAVPSSSLSSQRGLVLRALDFGQNVKNPQNQCTQHGIEV